MKKLSILLLAIPLSLSAQHISISTAGGAGSETVWNIGEPLVTTLSSENSDLFLTQGLLQPEHIMPSGITEPTSHSLSIRVYPNPVREKAFVETDAPGSWIICDMLGKMLASGELSAMAGEYIDTEYLAPGYYILSITTTKGQSSIQLIKQ